MRIKRLRQSVGTVSYWTPPLMWEDGECWIIGGGASLARQFGIPDDTIKNVESGQDPITIYSDYMKPIHDKHVIGVNLSFMFGPWVSMLYFCDTTFYRTYRKQINDFHNLKVTCVNHIDRNLKSSCINIKRMRRTNRPGLSKKPDTINWNYNSGAAAIDFAVKVGVKRILLLGFDMKPFEDGRTHWHEGYQNYLKPTREQVFTRFLKVFPKLAIDLKHRGVEVLNVNPDSALEDFKKVSLKDVL